MRVCWSKFSLDCNIHTYILIVSFSSPPLCSLSEEVNNIFSFTILWNFIAASLVICFAGFQITASNVEDIVLYFIFFSASLVQVFVVCYYGDEMISSVSAAANKSLISGRN